MNRFNRYESDGDPASELDENAQFALEKKHERRILSWSPDPDEDFVDDAASPAADEVAEQQPAVEAALAMPAALPEPQVEPEPVAPAPLPPVAPRPVEERYVPPAPAPVREQAPAAPAERVAPVPTKPILPNRPPQSAAGEEPKRRGRPRGRPRRQVHFHVDPDEELLLLEASRKHGSQQKGLVAALQSLQDIDVLRDEIERLRAECERQRVLLADAEAIFRR